MTVPRRRWFRFSLRTTLIVVTLVALPLGWVAYQLNWIRQRHLLLESHAVMPRHDWFLYPTAAPLSLRPFGESGWASLFYLPEGNTSVHDQDLIYRQVLKVEPPAPLSEKEVERVKAVFPEAQIVPFTRAF